MRTPPTRESRRAEHPVAQQHEAQHGGEQVGRDEHGELQRRGPGAAAQGDAGPQGAAGQAQAEAEDDQSLELVSGRARAADAEGEAAVGGGVGDRGDQQGEQVRALRAQRAAQQHEQQQVGQRADTRRRRRSAPLPGQPRRHAGDAQGGAAQLGRRSRTGSSPRPARGRAGRSRAGRPRGRRRCRRGCRGRRPSRPEPRAIRSPLRSARTSSSVSKNQRGVLDVRQQRARATSARIALKPHCASEKRVPQRCRSNRL